MVTNINLKLLQTFLLAAEHGSFRRAAEESNRSPSAISMQIRDLEEQVGMSLFIRTPHCVTLTPEGRLLYDQVGHAMGEVQAGLARLTELAAQRRGRVRIACAPTLADSAATAANRTARRARPARQSLCCIPIERFTDILANTLVIFLRPREPPRKERLKSGRILP